MKMTISAKPIGNMGLLFALTAALVMSTFSRQAGAQVLGEPAATVTAIYKQYQRQGDPKLPKGIYSGRLEKLMTAEKKRTPKDEIGRLDFDVFVNGQDWEIKNLNVTETERHGDRAVVRATFTNFDQSEEIVFDLVQQSNRWLIDEVVSRKKPRWTLSKILQGAPDAFPKD